VKTLQQYYKYWPEVTKQKWYHHKWLTNETYYQAIKAQFPTVESLTVNFDRASVEEEEDIGSIQN
jgi:hypothetical protein